MAIVGDMVGTTVSVSAGAYLTIKPNTDGEEWIIHNIYISLGDSVTIFRWNSYGTLPPTLSLMSTSCSLLSQHFHCSIVDYIMIQNVGSSTIYVGYDGIVTNT